MRRIWLDKVREGHSWPRKHVQKPGEPRERSSELGVDLMASSRKRRGAKSRGGVGECQESMG